MNKSVSLSMLAAALVLLFAAAVPASARNLMAVQPDGRIVLAGQGMPEAGALVRYLPDGQLDEGFGEGGIAIDRRLGPYLAMSLQQDGRILAATQRTVRPSPSIGRYLADGSPDPSFGDGGLSSDPTLDQNGGSPTAIVAGAGGRVLMASNLFAGKLDLSSSATITALSPSGQFERSLLKLRSPSLGAWETINDVLPGGIAVGSHPDPGKPEVERQMILRLQEGSPAGYDPDFGAGQGLSLGGGGRALAVVADPAGGFVVAGGRPGPGPGLAYGTVSRYDANGVLDPGFGTGGTTDLIIPGVGGVSLTAVAVAADGSIVAAGHASAYPGVCYGCASAVVARFTPDGQLDPGFGNGGVVILGSGTFADGRLPEFFGGDTAVLADGSILVAGTGNGSAKPLVLARLTPSGQLDPGFGNGGVVTTYTCKAAPNEAVQRGCYTRPRVSLRVKNLRTAKPRLRLQVRPDPSWGQIQSLRLVLPRSLRLHPRRIEKVGGVEVRGVYRDPKPKLRHGRIVLLDGVYPTSQMVVTLDKGAFSAVKKLGPRQRLNFKVVVGFVAEGNGPRVVVLHRRP